MAATALLAACSFDQIDKPPPPSTDVYEARLESPDGRFPDELTATEIFERLAAASRGVEEVCGIDPMQEPECLRDPMCRRCALLTQVSRAIETLVESVTTAADQPDAGARERVAGVRGLLHAQVTCRGFETPPRPAPENGHLEATLGFTERGLDPVIWGEVSDCRVPGASGARHQLSGDFVASFDAAAVRASNFQSIPILFAFDGEATPLGGGRPRRVSLVVRQRLDRAGSRSLAFTTRHDGSFTLAVSTQGAQFRGAGGTFTCRPEERECDLAQ